MARAKQTQTHNYEWYKARLLPTAQSIFTNSFYPDQTEAPNQVYCATIEVTPNNHKVIVTSRIAETSLRIMTLHLAQNCLTILGRASSSENERLNLAAQALTGKVE